VFLPTEVHAGGLVFSPRRNARPQRSNGARTCPGDRAPPNDAAPAPPPHSCPGRPGNVYDALAAYLGPLGRARLAQRRGYKKGLYAAQAGPRAWRNREDTPVNLDRGFEAKWAGSRGRPHARPVSAVRERGSVVNARGPGASGLCAGWAGLSLPVDPRGGTSSSCRPASTASGPIRCPPRQTLQPAAASTCRSESGGPS